MFRSWSLCVVRLLIFVGLTLSVMGCGSVKRVPTGSMTKDVAQPITVMTFNIRHGCGRARWGNTTSDFFKNCPKNYSDLVSAIRSADPDVVGLQEVSGNQAELIAKALGMEYVYGSHNSTGYGSWWGNAILTKSILIESEKVALGGSTGKNRSMITAIANVDQQPIVFASVHIDHRVRDNRSIEAILSFLDSIEIPVVLIGDFNMRPWSPRAIALTEYSGLIDAAGSPDTERMGTWDSPSGKRIDYIFVQSDHFNVVDSALVTDEYQHASDHIAYYAVIELNR